MTFFLSSIARMIILYALYLIVFKLLLQMEASDKIFFGFMLIVFIFDFIVSISMNIKARGNNNGRNRV